jgi:hypothetical protein
MRAYYIIPQLPEKQLRKPPPVKLLHNASVFAVTVSLALCTGNFLYH